MTSKIKILHFEGNAFDIEAIKRQLSKSKIKFEYKQVGQQATFAKALTEFNPDVILTDNTLPSFDSWQVLELVSKAHRDIPVIVITRSVSETFAAETLKKGAYDYFVKSNIFRLTNSIENALEKIKLEAEKQKYIEELEKTSELLKETERLAHLGSWTFNMETFETRWSDEAYHILGCEPGEIEGSFQTFLSFVHPEDRGYFEKMTSDAMVAENDEIKFAFRIIDKNNNIKYIRNELFMSRDNSGKVTKLTGFNLDITQEKENEIRLRESEDRYRNLFENNPMPMYVVDSVSYSFLDMNNAAIKHYGYSREEFMNMSSLDIRSPEEKARLIDYRSENQDLYKTGVWEHIKKDGSRIMTEVYADNLLFEGRAARIILAIDITAKINTETDLKKTKNKLKANIE